MQQRYMLWDFDGTLGFREGLWSGTLAQLLQTHVPERQHTIDDVRPFLQNGFFWHQFEVDHTDIVTADDWWQKMNPVFLQAFRGVGLAEEQAQELSRLVRGEYVNPTRWRLYEDVFPTLQFLTEAGWKHAILSNHVPELDQIVDALGLSPYIETIVNSAVIGYEKPNPEFFRLALKKLNHPQQVWMVGDSVAADIQGAEAAGIPAILVRKQESAGVLRSCPDLAGVRNWILSKS